MADGYKNRIELQITLEMRYQQFEPFLAQKILRLSVGTLRLSEHRLAGVRREVFYGLLRLADLV